MTDTPKAEANPTKTFTQEEVLQHKTEGDCWIIIHDKVYDITKFLDEHPGGSDILMEHAGKDGTEGFEDLGHTEQARQQLEPLFIGELALSEQQREKRHTDKEKQQQRQAQGSSLQPLILVAVLLVLAAIAYAQFLAK
eukprot:c45361_g1_i1.p1 GENE.c45361_g1_i1~~c45361_g1_i1.p1  ORF type:complete len:138 (+),score=33.25 c45361_g1_i1:48-461(+)